MFALRNLGGADAVKALTDSFESKSALLKHEVAYVLGQMQDAHATSRLKLVLEDDRENPMVRHEAAEAMGSIASEECLEMLKKVRLGGRCSLFVVFVIRWAVGLPRPGQRMLTMNYPTLTVLQHVRCR